MSLFAATIQPFVEFGFMRRALVGSIVLATGSAPVGIFLVLRRMSLMGDALSHAVLPGVAIGFLVAGGLSLTAMTLGGILAGLGVALLAGIVSRLSALREDISFATFYLMSLALGVLIVSLRGSNVDVLHVLFGTILAIDPPTLSLMGAITTATLLAFALIWRPLVAECFDPAFLRSVGGHGALTHTLFLLLVVLNLVAGFQALGTLMAVGLMMLPAAVATLWVRSLPAMIAVAAGIGSLSGFVGLLVSFHTGTAAGPTIILVAGAFYLASLLAAPAGPLAPVMRLRRA